MICAPVLGLSAYSNADDLKLYAAIESAEDAAVLQSDIDLLERWCAENSLRLNSRKCFVVSYSIKKCIARYDYQLYGASLIRFRNVVGLGVSFDDKLSFSSHICTVVGRANRTLGFIIRNCSDFRCVSTIVRLYYALVRPLLEYCSVVWNPCYNVYVDMLERVQKFFLRFLFLKRYGV